MAVKISASALNEALSNPKWKKAKAMEEEMEALIRNGTWELVSFPEKKETGWM